jgi:pilus assembly protein CpaF
VSEGQDNLPVRRRKTALSTEEEGGQIVTAQQASELRSEHIDEARSLGHPEQEFENWPRILQEVQSAFVQRSKGTGSASVRDPDVFYGLVNDIVTNRYPEIKPIDIPRVVELLRAHLFGYGALEDYMRIEGLEELYFNRYDQGFFIANGKKYRITDQIFSSPEGLRAFLDRVAAENGLELNLQKPILDAALADGSRLNASIEPIAIDGADFIIRKHRNIPFDLEDLIEGGVLSEVLARDLHSWVRGGLNIIVSGGTASGKTSFLNTIGKSFIPRTDRVLILENRKELQIATDDCKYFQTREDPTRPGSGDNDITLDVLVRSTLRKRPRRIIVGEVRGAEAYDALDAWNTGHEGSLCTIHANSAAEAIARLESLAGRSGQLDPIGIRRLIGGAVDIIVQLQLDEATGRRTVLEVIQVLHEFKFNRSDSAVANRVEEMKGDGRWQQIRDEVAYQQLYSRRDGEAVASRINDILPIVGRGPQS